MRSSLHMFPDPLSFWLFYNPIKWPRCAWNQECNLKRKWDQESVNMHLVKHTYTHTYRKPSDLIHSWFEPAFMCMSTFIQRPQECKNLLNKTLCTLTGFDVSSTTLADTHLLVRTHTQTHTPKQSEGTLSLKCGWDRLTVPYWPEMVFKTLQGEGFDSQGDFMCV